MHIDAAGLDARRLNERIKLSQDETIVIDNCLGQRYIGSGQSGRRIEINGTPGNALGAYLDGSHIVVHGNAQDAAGDTMNDGEIVIHGSCGDATGYAMRGGQIYVKGNAGYRAGIHMKAYREKVPAIVVGGSAGSFLGEYQAGGIIIVLGLGETQRTPVGYFCGTGMHGGKIYLRGGALTADFPKQVVVSPAESGDMAEIGPYLRRFCEHFSADYGRIAAEPFYVLRPDTKNPYKQLYTDN